MTAVRHAALLLAAGESRRLGTPKQLLPFHGEPLVLRAARALRTRPSALYVVVGARANEV
jgi:molybdenum cofactor cytidylyltransferase